MYHRTADVNRWLTSFTQSSQTTVGLLHSRWQGHMAKKTPGSRRQGHLKGAGDYPPSQQFEKISPLPGVRAKEGGWSGEE